MRAYVVASLVASNLGFVRAKSFVIRYSGTLALTITLFPAAKCIHSDLQTGQLLCDSRVYILSMLTCVEKLICSIGVSIYPFPREAVGPRSSCCSRLYSRIHVISSHRVRTYIETLPQERKCECQTYITTLRTKHNKEGPWPERRICKDTSYSYAFTDSTGNCLAKYNSRKKGNQ